MIHSSYRILIVLALAACPASNTDANSCAVGQLPVGAENCPDSAACCQSGADLPVGGGCPDLGTYSICVPRCNSSDDCPTGSCCVANPSSFPQAGKAPTEPGGWCLAQSVVQSLNATCLTGDANGYVCTGNGDAGYTCSPS